MTQPLPLWTHLDAILTRCLAYDRCAVLLDYDGTLTPIVSDPAAVCLSPDMRQVLMKLAQHRRYQVGIVSGRSLADLQEHIPASVPYLAGNHGLEIVGPQITYCHPEAERRRPQLQVLAQSLRSGLEELTGVWVENKGLSLTVHFRAVPPADWPAVQDQILRLARPLIETRDFVVRQGKAVLEVRPQVAWDKGKAVRWLVDHMCADRPARPMVVLYIGDDDTDEDAFRALGSEGVGIVVGYERTASAARYALESVDQTARFLSALNALR